MIAGIVFLLAASMPGQPSQQTVPDTKTHSMPIALAENASLNRRDAGIAVPFEYFKQHIYIKVNVDGRSGLLFMLDSGANKNILNLRTARQLGMHPEKIARESNVGFAAGRISVGGVKTVRARIDSTDIADDMTVMDLTPFERRFGHATDGMLGSPFLKRFTARVDFQKKLLTLFPADRYAYHGSGESVRISGRSSSIVIPVILSGSEYDSHPAQMEVDTGSNATLSVYRHCVHRLHLEQSILQARLGLGYGVNGDFSNTQGAIDSLGIGRVETYNLPVDYFEPAEPIHPKCEVAGSMGNGVLQSFKAVIFDVPHDRIIFEMNTQPVQLGAMQNENLGR